MKCGPVQHHSGFTKYRYITIKRGSGGLEKGTKGSRGYQRWKVKIKPSGKVSVNGSYYAYLVNFLVVEYCISCGSVGIDF